MHPSTSGQPKAAPSVLLNSSQGEALHNNSNLNSGARNSFGSSSSTDTPAHHPPLRPWPFGNEAVDPSRPSSKRDWRNLELREKFPDVPLDRWLNQGEERNWKIWAAFREAIVKVEDIRNGNSDFNRTQLEEFLGCGARVSWGSVTVYEGGERRITPHSCGLTPCPYCHGRGKARVHDDIKGYVMSAAKTLGFQTFHQQVFTMPPPVEHLAVKGSKVRQQLKDGIRKIQRKACRLRVHDGLAAYCSVHAVGDRDLLKDRFHFHAGFFPFASVKQKSGEFLVKLCDPGRIPHQWIKDEWLKLLRKVFPEFDLDVAVVHLNVELFDHPNITWILDHHLKYDGRGFGKDFEKAPLAFDPVSKRVVIQSEKGGYSITTMEELALRWKWVRSQRDYATWGILSQRKKYAPILGIEEHVEEEPEIKEKLTVTVERKRGKVWKKGKGIVWVDEKKAYYKGLEIVGVEWGRKGGSEWRPRISGPPDNNRKT